MSNDELNNLARSVLWDDAYAASLRGKVLLFAEGEPKRHVTAPLILGLPEVYKVATAEYSPEAGPDDCIEVTVFDRVTLRGKCDVVIYVERGFLAQDEGGEE